MYFKIKILVISILFSVFTSCINEINFDAQQLSNNLVLNCLVSPDSLVKANFTNSRFFLEPDADFVTVKDLEVNLYINGIFKETLKLKGSNYVSTYRTKVGERVKISALRVATGSNVTAQTLVPGMASLTSIDSSRIATFNTYMTHDTIDNQQNKRIDTLGYVRNFKFVFDVKLLDDAEIQNYYRLSATIRQTYSDGKSSSKKFVLYPDDAVFDRIDGADVFDANSSRNFNIFTDSTFKGQYYTLKTSAKLAHLLPTPSKIKFPSANMAKIPVKTELIFDLQGIDSDFFNYLKTVKYNNTSLQYFSEPVQVFNNVTNGIGLLGGLSHRYYTFRLPAGLAGYYY